MLPCISKLHIHSLTTSQRLVLLTGNTLTESWFQSHLGVEGSSPHRKMKNIACDRLDACKHWRWLTQCTVCDSTGTQSLFVSIGEYALDANGVEANLFVNMRDDALHAKSAEALLFVTMGDDTINTNISCHVCTT